MTAILLDVAEWELVDIGGGWRHVNHKRRLATSHWITREAAERNAHGYRGDTHTLSILADRYEKLFA